MYYISSFTNNGNGILQVSKMEGKLQCAPACHGSMVARRGSGGGCLAGCANFYNGIFTSSFSCTASNLLCISAPAVLSTAGASGFLCTAAYLLQMFKVSLFIIYTATVLDFVEVEHYIHNQAHNGYSHGLRTPNECINQRNI